MKQQGELAELEFYVQAYGRGMVVSKPFGDNAKYDFIVDNGGRLSRVQVKSVGSTQGTSSTSGNSSYRVLLAYGANNKKPYTSKDVDMFAVWVIPERCWYFIPVGDVHSLRISLYPHRTLSRFSNKATAHYEQYRDEWVQFK